MKIFEPEGFTQRRTYNPSLNSNKNMPMHALQYADNKIIFRRIYEETAPTHLSNIHNSSNIRVKELKLNQNYTFLYFSD